MITDDCSKRRAERLEKLVKINILINSSLDIDTVLSQILSAATQVMEANAASIMVLDEESGDLLCQQAVGEVGQAVCREFRIPKGTGIAGWVAENRKPVRIADAHEDPRFNPEMDRKTGFRTRSLLCVPLMAKDRFIGVAQVLNKEVVTEAGVSIGEFNEEDEELFGLFAQQAALAIENARLHRSLLQQQRLDWDLNIARQIQQSFLPTGPLHVQGVELYTHYHPAFQVGGDIYDYFLIGPDRLALVIGDVSGKGVSAALYTARFISDLRSLAQQDRRPKEVVETMNRYQFERSRFGMFITLIFGILDLKSGQLEYVYAGHPPIFWSRPDEFCIQVKGPSGPPLGIFADRTYTPGELTLETGDTLLWYTDGIIEVMNQHGQINGVEWLGQILKASDISTETLVKKIDDQVHRFGGQDSFYDDIAMMVVRMVEQND